MEKVGKNLRKISKKPKKASTVKRGQVLFQKGFGGGKKSMGLTPQGQEKDGRGRHQESKTLAKKRLSQQGGGRGKPHGQRGGKLKNPGQANPEISGS